VVPLLSNCTPDTIFKLLQMSETQRIKIKRKLLLLLDFHRLLLSLIPSKLLRLTCPFPFFMIMHPLSQLCYRPVVTYCMVYHYTKRVMLARLLANKGPAIYVVHCVTNFIQPYLYQFFDSFHGLNGYEKPSRRPFNRC